MGSAGLTVIRDQLCGPMVGPSLPPACASVLRRRCAAYLRDMRRVGCQRYWRHRRRHDVMAKSPRRQTGTICTHMTPRTAVSEMCGDHPSSLARENPSRRGRDRNVSPVVAHVPPAAAACSPARGVRGSTAPECTSRRHRDRATDSAEYRRPCAAAVDRASIFHRRTQRRAARQTAL